MGLALILASLALVRTRLYSPARPCGALPQAAGRLSSGQLQLPTTYKPGDLKHSPLTGSLRPFRLHTLTHTPVDTQNGAGHRQHTRGTRGDHAVKWTGVIFL